MPPEQHKPKVDVRALVSRLSKENSQLREREIIAPLLPNGRIRVRLSGMVHEFKPREPFVGWGRFRPLDEREAEVLGEALPWERGAYLELFPALRVILLWSDPDLRRPGTWWAIPFNGSDARQRFGFSGEPFPVLLCDPTNGADRFERVIARVDGSLLWFEGPDALADPTHAEWLRDAAASEAAPESFLPGLTGSERFALVFWQIRQLDALREVERHRQADAECHRQAIEREQARQQNRRAQREWLQAQALRRNLEENLRHALAKADAHLHSYSEIPSPDGSPGQLVVEWSERGKTYRYRSVIEPNLTVASSGICLSRRDRDFDLTSLVGVMTDRHY